MLGHTLVSELPPELYMLAYQPSRDLGTPSLYERRNIPELDPVRNAISIPTDDKASASLLLLAFVTTTKIFPSGLVLSIISDVLVSAQVAARS